jgi:hypothetical protein
MRDDIRSHLEKAKLFQSVFSGKSQQLPFLEDYCKHAGKMPSRVLQNLLIGCAGAVGGAMSLVVALALGLSGEWIAAGAVFVGFPLLWGTLAWGIGRLRRPRTARDQREIEIKEAVVAFKPLLTKRRLAKSVGSATAVLLEEAARYWNRATTALNGAFWTDESLPGHWQTVRTQALEAADDAMGDLILLAEQNMQPVSSKSDWQDVVGNVVGGLLGVEEQASDEPLPPMFGTARDIAEKLKLLASQVEQATQQVIKEQPENELLRSTASLDACLSELKSIQEAETELQQNQGI